MRIAYTELASSPDRQSYACRRTLLRGWITQSEIARDHTRIERTLTDDDARARVVSETLARLKRDHSRSLA